MKRNYEPAIGRYLTPDPIGIKRGGGESLCVCSNLIDPYRLTGLEAAIGSGGAYALTRWAIEGTPLGEGAIGDWVYDNLHSPVNDMEKGERGWEKASGDDPQ